MFWDDVEKMLKIFNFPDINFDGKVDRLDYLNYCNRLNEEEKECAFVDDDDTDDFDDELPDFAEDSDVEYYDDDEIDESDDDDKVVAPSKNGFGDYVVRRAGYSDENICVFCKVDVTSFVSHPLYYLTGDLDLSVGDKVVVPLGRTNDQVDGVVVSVGKCYASIFPFDIEKIKKVLRKKNR